jgi:hypothetical protein
VLNVGAGAGNYEPADRVVVGIDPSVTMLRQRSKFAGSALIGTVESLPFADQTFDAAMGTFTPAITRCIRKSASDPAARTGAADRQKWPKPRTVALCMSSQLYVSCRSSGEVPAWDQTEISSDRLTPTGRGGLTGGVKWRSLTRHCNVCCAKYKPS